MTTSYLQVITTTETRQQAQDLARAVVTARLAACVQVVGPIDSTYWWEDAVESAQEWMCVMKTTVDGYPALEDRINAEHSYETPEIVATAITRGSEGYLQWLQEEVHGGGTAIDSAVQS